MSDELKSAYELAMERLRATGMVEPLRARLLAGKPTLAICLGMQLLFELLVLGLDHLSQAWLGEGDGQELDRLSWHVQRMGRWMFPST
ncbi:MAG: hypothetical protein HC882_06715 [Acidobacteria bacterium]|nr:hypothetical protein [Acidobacteriota bacterium]